jgi:hypothetical protein
MQRGPALFPDVETGAESKLVEVTPDPLDGSTKFLWNTILAGAEQVLSQSPQPGAVTVDLKVRPVVHDIRTIESESGRRHMVWMQCLAFSMPVDRPVD